MSDGHSEVNCAARWHPVVVGEYTHRHADKYWGYLPFIWSTSVYTCIYNHCNKDRCGKENTVHSATLISFPTAYWTPANSIQKESKPGIWTILLAEFSANRASIHTTHSFLLNQDGGYSGGCPPHVEKVCLNSLINVMLLDCVLLHFRFFLLFIEGVSSLVCHVQVRSIKRVFIMGRPGMCRCTFWCKRKPRRALWLRSRDPSKLREDQPSGFYGESRW